jgi:hypothetical protein
MTDQKALNRNNVVGDFARFERTKRTMDEIVADALKTRRVGPDLRSRPSEEIIQVAGFSLVRYHLGSPEHLRDLERLDAPYYTNEGVETAVFGILDGEGNPNVVFDVLNDGNGPHISFAHISTNPTVHDEAVVEFLRHLDVPASWRAGADLALSESFNARIDESGIWQLTPERHLIMVSFERHCFGTKPALKETVDVLVLPSPEYDLNDADETGAYWAADHYRGIAWDELNRLPQARGRPGFSSWLHAEGAPQMIKVLDSRIDGEIRRLDDAALQAPATPAS